MELTTKAAVLTSSEQETVLTRGSGAGRNAEENVPFSCSLMIWFRGFQQNALFVPEKLFWMINFSLFQVASPKKSFSGTNNAKILQKPPPPKICQEQKKEDYGNH